MSASSAEKGKGEYSLVVDEDTPSRRGSVSLGGGASSSGAAAGAGALLSGPALPIAAYCASSVAMTLVNKFVVSGKKFDMNFLLLTIQSVVCVSCVAVCKRLGIVDYRPFDRDAARKWFPISFLLCCVIYTGSKALQHLSIPVYTIFKNLTIILIAYGELVFFSSSITSLTLVSFALMVISSLIAASNDIASALGQTLDSPTQPTSGYLWMFANCAVSAAFVLLMRKRIKLTGFTDWETLRYNNLLSVPVLAFFSFALEDWTHESLVRNFPEETRTSLLTLMVLSGAAAVGISFCTAWVIRTTSSTTFSMVGALNKLPVAASGILFFGDPATFSSVTSIVLGFLAGLVYSAAKTAQKQAENSKLPGSR